MLCFLIYHSLTHSKLSSVLQSADNRQKEQVDRLKARQDRELEGKKRSKSSPPESTPKKNKHSKLSKNNGSVLKPHSHGQDQTPARPTRTQEEPILVTPLPVALEGGIRKEEVSGRRTAPTKALSLTLLSILMLLLTLSPRRTFLVTPTKIQCNYCSFQTTNQVQPC